MIDTVDIPNWREWPERTTRPKTESGVNAAYFNENRRTHTVKIETRAYENLDTARVTASCDATDESDTKTFEGEYEEIDALRQQAIDHAEQFMRDHPCPREGERDAVELLTDLHEALRKAGCPPIPAKDFRGWSNVGGDPGFAVQPLVKSDDGLEPTATPAEADRLRIRFNVDGKEAGLRYREYEEVEDDGDVIQLHEPRSPESISGKLQNALEATGLEVDDVEKGSHQTHWDHDVGYRAITRVPDDLVRPRSFERDRTGLFA